MENCRLVEIITKDNLVHQGVFFEPTRKTKSKTAVLLIHGLGSNFYSNLPLLEVCREVFSSRGIGFALFNTRGHDSVTGMKKIDKNTEKRYTRVMGGAGTERFEECVYDIDAGISFLIKEGFTTIILIGRSTGANKACFYVATQQDPRVSGVVLASPVSDRLIPAKRISRFNLFIAQGMRAIGKGNMLMPFANSYPMTSDRLLSLMTTHSNEDVFDYDDVKHGLKQFGKISKPLLVLLGELDESMDRPAFVIKAAYDKKATSKQYTSGIIENADHGFSGKEKEFIHTISKWIETL